MNASTKTGPKPSTALPVHIRPDAAMRELADLRRKLTRGAKRLGEFTEEDLAIATTPADEVYREDMMRLYRCHPTAAKRIGISVLIV
jgi:poly(3-hydroxyalkanoate) synthetase